MKVLSLVVLLGTLCLVVAAGEDDILQTQTDYLESDDTTISTVGKDNRNVQPESKVLESGQAKKKLKVKGPSKKTASKLLPLLLIPLMIQSQLMPIMLLKLKMMALKAMMVGKLALLILALNLVRNAIIGADDIDQQYEQQTLAEGHYGYNGGPEYGSWVNRRIYRADPYRAYS